MRIDEAKKQIILNQEFIDAYEKYDPQNVKQETVKLYAELGSVQKVAQELNKLGYRKEGKLVAGKRAQVKYISNDITNLINDVADDNDELHPMIQKILNRNRRRKGVST